MKTKFVSCSDPAAQWSAANKGHAFFACSTNDLIDLDHAVIVNVEASRANRQAEIGATRIMIERTRIAMVCGAKGRRRTAPYGSAENLAWLVHERGIDPHILVFDKSQRKWAFERAAFSFDLDGRLHLPGGKATQTAPEGLSNFTPSGRSGRHATLPRQQRRL